MKTKKLAKRLAKHLERFVTNDLLKQFADMASRHESDLITLRRERDDAVRQMGEALARVAEIETCYKNATETIQRQADRLSGTAYLPTDEALAAVRKERDDALVALDGERKAHDDTAKVHLTIVRERDNALAACEAAEKEAERLRSGPHPHELTAGAVTLDTWQRTKDALDDALERLDTAANALSEAGGEVKRLRGQVTRALDRLRFVDRAGADVAIRDTREILEGRPVRGEALMRERDEQVLSDFPKVVVGGEEV